jgi:hypothetical protein
VYTELIEHSARVLRHAPARSLTADELHRRVVREAGLSVGLAAFLDCLRASPDRFALLAPSCEPLLAAVWDETARHAYAAAFAQTGMSTWPLVTLAETPAEPVVVGPLSDVHDDLAEFLRVVGDDDHLRAAVSEAAAGLAALGRLPDAASPGAACPPRCQEPAARSSTLHHSSSASSASTMKPATSAAARTSGASSPRMPDRMAQPPVASAP